MNARQRTLWRLAADLAGCYARPATTQVDWGLAQACRELERTSRLLQRARRLGFPLAEARLAAAHESAVRSVADGAQRNSPPRRDTPHPRMQPTAAAIYWDLAALDEEFPRLEVGSGRSAIAVTTGPITLAGLELGAFEVRLELGRPEQGRPELGRLAEGDPCYRVAALDANAARARPEVTHPHVVDEHLCEGEGSGPIRAAALEGRLYDLFVVVRQVLETYNEHSAYVTLDDWHGVDCGGCGDSVSDPAPCESCERGLCDACCCGCHTCGGNWCSGCLSDCPCCDGCYCASCLASCRRCGALCCENCLDHHPPEEGLCETCTHQNEVEREAGEAFSQARAAADAVAQEPRSRPCGVSAG